jgi:ATP-dependent exoDNAse (exonuclease V) alpha subunit
MEKLEPRVWWAVYYEYKDAHQMQGTRYYDPQQRGVVVGEIKYLPLRVAYASSYHKVQGLTLDNVQVNVSHYWAGQSAMCYVALSRARSIEGLRVVGDVGRLARRIKTDSRVRRWV